MTSKDIMEKINEKKFHELSRLQLIKAITDLQIRLSLATEYNQGKMDNMNCCWICGTYYHPDYCYKRDSGEVQCDVCYDKN